MKGYGEHEEEGGKRYMKGYGEHEEEGGYKMINEENFKNLKAVFLFFFHVYKKIKLIYNVLP